MAASSSNASALRWRWLIPVFLLLALFEIAPLGVRLDRAFFDAASRQPFRPPPIPEGSAIVVMDDRTLEVLSQKGLGATWPPPRATFAALIAGLHRAGASRIVLDFIFLDRSAAQEQDQFLGAVAASLPSVVLARTARQAPVFWDDKFRTEHRDLFVTQRMGQADAMTDPDGVIREYAFANSLAAAAAAKPHAATRLLRWHGGTREIGAPEKGVPILSAWPFIIEGLGSIERVTASGDTDFDPRKLARTLAAEPPLSPEIQQNIRGRVVLVGVNAIGTFDQKPLAIGGLEPGVLVHWTAWTNLVAGTFIDRAPGFAAPGLAVLIVCGLAFVRIGQSGIVRPILIAATVATSVLAVSYLALSSGWFLPPATPVAAAGFTLIGVVAENYWLEHRRRQEVQAMFGSYVAPEVVELLVRDPNAIQLGGEKREASVFFCDLAGFTDLSEAVKPEELLELVNGYLQETSDCLLEHGAYIDKYIGDAVMAVFGAPLPLPKHALAACRGALAAQRILAERNVRLAKTHGRTLGMRIGINTGEMIVGNLGSARKRNYTVLGDAVNLASRLEGANKEFGTSILLGETTARLVRDDLVLRPLTALRVKGKQTAVHVFELVGEKADLTPAQREFLHAYGEGHVLYTSRRFAEAADALARAADLAPADEMTQSLLADARALAAKPPAENWEPILSLKTK